MQNLFEEVASKPGVTRTFELRLQHADGSWRHIESSYTNLLHDPTVSGLVVNSRNVTERKRAEEALQESYGILRAVTEGTTDFIYVKDLDGRYVMVNSAAASFLGKPAQEVIGKDDTELFPPEIARNIIEHDRTVIASGETQAYEERDFVIDGETRSNVAVTGVWRDARGDAIGVFGISRDITERKRAEEKLRVSEAELRALFEAMNDLIMVFDGDGRCLKIAPTTPSNLYRPPEELLGKTFHEVFPKDQADTFLDQVRRTLETRSTNTFEFNLQLDDRQGWFEATFSPMLENTAVAVARDITERKRAEEQIRFQAHLLGQVQAAVIATDLEGMVTYWNEHAERLYGWSREEALGRNSAELTLGLTEVGEVEEIMEQLRTIETWEGEAELRRKDGSTFFAHVSISLTHDVEGQPVGIVGVSADITERKRAEEELHQSEERYRSVVDNVKEVIFQTDAEGLWTFLNPAWTEVTGFSVEESIGKSFLGYVHPEDRQRNLELFRPLIEREKDYCRHEIRYLTKEGDFRWIEVWARLTLGEDDAIVGTSGTLNDITERKQAEDELRRSESELTEAQRMAHVGNWSFDITRDEGRWSDEMYRIFGFAPQEFPITYKKF